MDYLYFNEYEKHPDAKINSTLLWEYNLADFDFEKMRDIVVQRVIERGWPNDWYFVLNFYGEDAVRQSIKAIPYLNDKDANFVSKVFEIPLSEMKCYEKETVSSGTLELLRSLMLDENLSDFFLVGGTALSLQIGHRTSIDIDLFSEKPFDENAMLGYLESQNRLQLDYLARNTIKGQIAETKVDLITHSYPLIEDLQVIEQIRIASLEDIAAMKLNAIMGNGTRLKDFIDIAYLSCHISLKKMIDAYGQKYSSRNPLLVLKALAYHQDINFDEPINMLMGKFSWKKIERRLADMGEISLNNIQRIAIGNVFFPQLIVASFFTSP